MEMIRPAALRRLLVCTDESPDSQGAFAAALELARSSSSRVYLLEVVTFFPGYELQPQDLMAPTAQLNLELITLRDAAVRDRLEAMKAEAATGGVDIEVRVRNGATVHGAILEEAGTIQPDLIIVGRHGLSGLSRLLMGSATARIIGHSPFDVLVVPRGAALAFRRLLVASDGSPYSVAAWEEALNLAKRMGSEVIAVSVARDEAELPRVESVIAELQRDADQAGVPAKALMLRGRPEYAILNLATVKDVDLIIMGSHGRTGLARLLMGSVAERVIGQASCPVLVVKREPR